MTLQHASRFSYGERIAVEDEAASSVRCLSENYRRFVDHLVELANPWESLETVRTRNQVNQFLAESERHTPQAEVTDEEIDSMLRAYQKRSEWTEQQQHDRNIHDDREHLISETDSCQVMGIA